MIDRATDTDKRLVELEQQKDENEEQIESMTKRVEKAFEIQNANIKQNDETVVENRRLTNQIIERSNDHHDTLEELRCKIEDLKQWQDDLSITETEVEKNRS